MVPDIAEKFPQESGYSAFEFCGYWLLKAHGCDFGWFLQVDLLSYQKYLREVMTLLMSDSDFAQKILDVGNELSQKVAS